MKVQQMPASSALPNYRIVDPLSQPRRNVSLGPLLKVSFFVWQINGKVFPYLLDDIGNTMTVIKISAVSSSAVQIYVHLNFNCCVHIVFSLVIFP